LHAGRPPDRSTAWGWNPVGVEPVSDRLEAEAPLAKRRDLLGQLGRTRPQPGTTPRAPAPLALRARPDLSAPPLDFEQHGHRLLAGTVTSVEPDVGSHQRAAGIAQPLQYRVELSQRRRDRREAGHVQGVGAAGADRRQGLSQAGTLVTGGVAEGAHRVEAGRHRLGHGIFVAGPCI
jgi:hypothetical protein